MNIVEVAYILEHRYLQRLLLLTTLCMKARPAGSNFSQETTKILSGCLMVEYASFYRRRSKVRPNLVKPELASCRALEFQVASRADESRRPNWFRMSLLSFPLKCSRKRSLNSSVVKQRDANLPRYEWKNDSTCSVPTMPVAPRREETKTPFHRQWQNKRRRGRYHQCRAPGGYIPLALFDPPHPGVVVGLESLQSQDALGLSWYGL